MLPLNRLFVYLFAKSFICLFICLLVSFLILFYCIFYFFKGKEDIRHPWTNYTLFPPPSGRKQTNYVAKIEPPKPFWRLLLGSSRDAYVVHVNGRCNAWLLYSLLARLISAQLITRYFMPFSGWQLNNYVMEKEPPKSFWRPLPGSSRNTYVVNNNEVNINVNLGRCIAWHSY